MNAAFLNQWQLYRRGAQRPPLVGLESATESAFDADVAVGEIRVFADTNRPLVALVVEDRKLSGWRIVPVSPFCAPASTRELMVGERVFQLWNATVVSRRFVARSWRVDALSDADLAEVRAAIPAARPGCLTAGDDVQAKYEREFLVGAGTLVPFAAPRAAVAPRFAWWSAAMKVAASLAVCVAAWYVLMMGSGRQVVRNWRDSFRFVNVAPDEGVIELVDAQQEPGEPVHEVADVDIDFTQPVASWFGRSPAPTVFPRPKFADVKGPKIPEGLSKFSLKLEGEGYKSTLSEPMAVVFLTPAEPGADGAAAAKGGVFSYASAVKPLAAQPKVSCELCEDSRSGFRDDAILVIEGESAPGVKVSVLFDPNVVAGYREGTRFAAPSEKRTHASYGLRAFPGKEQEIGPESVFVTLVWTSKDGIVRTPLVPLCRPPANHSPAN